MDIPEVLSPYLRLGTAILAAAVLGWERERHHKPAGLRTHMMVSLGACLFVLAGMRYVASLPGDTEFDVDPTRVFQGIIGGIGFLGAGCIVEARGDVRGITTAASVWLVAGIGIAAGLGQYDLVAASVVSALLILAVLGFLTGHRNGRPPADDG